MFATPLSDEWERIYPWEWIYCGPLHTYLPPSSRTSTLLPSTQRGHTLSLSLSHSLVWVHIVTNMNFRPQALRRTLSWKCELFSRISAEAVKNPRNKKYCIIVAVCESESLLMLQFCVDMWSNMTMAWHSSVWLTDLLDCLQYCL